MLPNLSQLRLHQTCSTEYQASKDCPTPSGAGDLREGRNVQTGDSAKFELATDQIRPVRDVKNAEYDWENGTTDLAEETTFVHIATAGLPINLKDGTKLRTLTRTYAHTDVLNWIWKGGDRVIVHWPPGMPFQIMGSLNNSRDAPYQRSCKLLNSKDPVVLAPDSDGKVTWPFANVAVVLPPVFYSVIGTPTSTQTPKEFAVDAFKPGSKNGFIDDALNEMLTNTVRSAVEVPKVEEHAWNRNVTVFTSSEKQVVGRIQDVFKGINDPYQRYELELTPEVSDSQKKRKGLYVAVGLLESNLTYKLTVSKTCMYEETHLKAHFIDLSGYVMGGEWLPKRWTYFNPYKTVKNRIGNGLVLLNGSLRTHVRVKMFTFSNDDTLDDLRVAFDDTILDETVDLDTVRLQVLSAVELREQVDDSLDKKGPEEQMTIVRGFVRSFQSLVKDHDDGLVDFPNFASRCDYFAAAFVVLMESVDPANLNLTLKGQPQTIPESLKRIIRVIGDEDNNVSDLLCAVQRFTDQSFQHKLFREFDRDGEVVLMRKMMRCGMTPPPDVVIEDEEDDDDM